MRELFAIFAVGVTMFLMFITLELQALNAKLEEVVKKLVEKKGEK